MNSQNTQQSTNDTHNELSEDLKNSEIDVTLENHNIEDNSLDLQNSTELNLTLSNIGGCCLDKFGRCVPCPPQP
ncbi:hypothetical protein NSTC731_03352 [Nostoc sp. DSM 114167]|jgi:hypothetical protein